MAPEHPAPADRSDFVEFTREETEQSVFARFDRVVERCRDRVAVQTPTARVTYGELASRVDAIARAVVAYGGAKSEPVALLMNDDLAAVAAMLAVLKAGKFFVPMNPAQPDARLQLVLEDAGVPLVLSDARHGARARSLASKALDVDAIDARSPSDAPVVHSAADAPAYVIYTSGSTGRPKGVLLNQRAVLHNTLIHTNFLRITPGDRLTLLASRATGQSMTAIFSSLLNGAALHPFDLRERGVSGLGAWIVDDRITIFHSSATVFREFAGSASCDMRSSSLRVVKLGSEAVSRRDVERFHERFPADCVFVNALSSTETGTIRQMIDRDTPVEGDLVPVGYPVPDVDVQLIGEDGAPVAHGDVGEICVRSRYLASGYWNHSGIAYDSFVPDRDDPGARVFRTGDVGRMAPDGCLYYLGRRDFRVKIRGNRVEPMEIEAALLGLDSVKEVAVVAHDDGRGTKRLVAYIVPAMNDGAPSAGPLRAFLASKLPRHMVPSAFVFLAELPRSAGGKLDRKALPAWRPAAAHGADSLPPRDLLETQLAGIWEELLGVDAIGIGDDFFDLGGDSLLAVEMALRVEQACGVGVPLQDMVEALTVEKLATMLVDRNADNVRAPITALQSAGSKPPFVFAHGAIASDGFYCRRLARALGNDRPFYVLQPHGLDGKPLPPTIEAMADDRLGALFAVQPKGPYLLGGFCAGGAVVFEMARRLERRGERVDLVVLIDTHASNARFRTWSKLVAGIAPVVGLSPAQRSSVFRRGRTFLRGLKRASRQGPREAVLFVVKKPYLVLRGANGPESTPARAPLDARQVVWLHYHHALEDYVPERYAGRVVLFRSSHLEHKTPGNFEAGWQHVCESLDVQAIAGDHRTCVTTHVDDLAAKIRAALDSAV